MSLVPRPRAPGDLLPVRVHKPTIYQDNAERFASTAGDYLDQERHVAVRTALQLVVEGRPGRAQYVLARSVMRQARIAGLGDVVIAGCPCGGRCRS